MNWELILAGKAVRPGKVINIDERGETETGPFLLVRDGESGDSSRLRVHSNVSIGGRDYLLLRDESAGELIVVRLLDKQRIVAMDPDRFSSLKNALLTYLEHQQNENRPSLKELGL